jgi:hypothetical protein
MQILNNEKPKNVKAWVGNLKKEENKSIVAVMSVIRTADIINRLD